MGRDWGGEGRDWGGEGWGGVGLGWGGEGLGWGGVGRGGAGEGSVFGVPENGKAVLLASLQMRRGVHFEKHSQVLEH